MKRKIVFVIAMLSSLFVFTGCGQAKRDMKQEDPVEATTEQKKEISNDSEKDTITQPVVEEKADISNLDGYLNLMPGVTSDMLVSEYWIKDQENADQILMTSQEITHFNDHILWDKAERNKYKDLEEASQTSIDGTVLRKYLDESETFSQAVFENGKEISQSYWNSLVDNEDYDSIQEENEISFGFATQRASIKQFPTEDILSQGDAFTFFDDNQISTTLVGEPLIVIHHSKDDLWYYILTESCGGWVMKENVALSEDKDSWMKDKNPEIFLVVTGDRIQLEYDPLDLDSSKKELTMGCRLPLRPAEEFRSSEEGRCAYGNYVVSLPVRQENGKIKWKNTYVPVSRDVHVGYLSYNRRNIVDQAYKMLGNRYGWGGMYYARDCSQYIMEIFRCFGIILPRNSIGLSLMNSKTVSLEGLSDGEKKKKLDEISMGSILYMQGHVMIYLGQRDGQYYVISSSASSIPEGEEVVNAHSVLINGLNLKRKNGETWLESIECAKEVVE